MNDTAGLPECIKEIQNRLEKYSRSSLKEAQTRLIFIDPMLKALGWDVSNPDEVDVEHATVDGKAVDYALRIHGRVVLLIEAKSLGDPLTDVKAITQVIGYASNEGVDWCVLTNGMTYKVYRSTEKASAPEKLLFEVSVYPTAAERISVDQTAEELRRISRKAMENGVLDQLAEQVFTKGKVRKALEKLFSDPPPKFIGIVRNAIGDGSIKSNQVKEAMRGLWAEWHDTRSLNRFSSSPKDSKVKELEDINHRAPPSDSVQYGTQIHQVPYPTKIQHPPVKTTDGRTLAPSIRVFARDHNPPLKYEGMRTAIDVLTACKSPTGEDYDFHYDVDYRRDGIYVERKLGPGYRTLQEDVDVMQRKAGLGER